ncbi:Fic family protein [Enorma phocaeensis]|uniref:Fic family protein n=2 Tax=Enorma phocaeensis TaxID=1871019 RepID=A0ABT7V8I0_9ACTN|nr:Fic family protein [Enorma phocaeensis]
MMQGLIDSAGSFRSGNVGVFDGDNLIHAGTPARYVPTVMADLFSWLRTTEMHPLLSSCIFHYEFEFIHPFADGNGRTGRLWHTLLLSHWRPLPAWLPTESVILSRQQECYAALAASNTNGSSEQFVAFMLEIIRDALLPYAKPEDALSEKEQRTLEYFSRNPKGTIADLAQVLACSKRSTERLVSELRADGKLERQGSPRAGTWIVVSR